MAPPGFNRWRVPPASWPSICASARSTPGAFSTRNWSSVHGVVASAADDWTLSEVVWVFTVAIVFLGLSAAFAGKWLERVGPRTVGTVAALCWGGGLILGGVGICLHKLGSCSMRLWRDRRLRAGPGLRLAGQHVDPLVSRPARHGDGPGDHGLRRRSDDRRALERSPDAGVLSRRRNTWAARRKCKLTHGRRPAHGPGRRPAAPGGRVWAATRWRNCWCPNPRACTSSAPAATASAETFLVLGTVYALVMLAAALSFRIPAPDWRPAGWTPPDRVDRPGG